MKKNYFVLKIAFIFILNALAFNLKSQVYCVQQALSSADDEIFNVSIGTLNNTSSCASTGGPGSILSLYSNYTTIVPAPNLVTSNIFNLSVTVGQCNGYAYSGNVYVWIDYNINGLFTDPGELVFQTGGVFQVVGTVFTTTVLIPANAVSGITRMRVTAVEGSVANPCSNYTWGETEDYNVNIAGIPCAGAPGANSVITPSYQVCPGVSLPIGLANTYTTAGFTYQWQSSTVSAVGPWTSIAGASLTTYSTSPLTTNIYYSAIITCTASNQNITALTGSISVAGTTTNTPPYFDGFESVGLPNLLPNCSWAASALGTACQTFTGAATGNRSARTGSKFAVFNSASGIFYTNGIALEAGVTYSTSLWFKTDAIGNLNWTNLNIKVGPNQTSVGANIVATTIGPAVSSAYKSLSNTFSVASSGLYYLAVSATYSGVGAPYLVWDDLDLTIPCNLNTPNILINASAATICAGQSLIISASGAANYLWNNGSTNPSINVSPLQTTLYSVTGTSSLSGCSGSASQLITVNQSPLINILTPNSVICAGASANLQASGANSYVWGNGLNSANISVSPLVSTTYSVFGTNSFGCSGTGSQLITVNPNPTITATGVSKMCKGENVTFNASGATSYSWTSNSIFLQGNPVTVSPISSAIYTVSGSLNGCLGSTLLSLEVLECVGLKDHAFSLNAIQVYPNPSNGLFSIDLKNNRFSNIELIDLTGRVVFSTSTSTQKSTIDINHLSAGVYYLKIKTAEGINTVKIIKN